MQFCGAGIEISGNSFVRNNGFKRHNGGAGVVACKVYTDTSEYFV